MAYYSSFSLEKCDKMLFMGVFSKLPGNLDAAEERI
jgi:hypothetical protein